MAQIQKFSKAAAGIFAGLSLTLVILMAALWIKGKMHPEETPSVFGLVPLDFLSSLILGVFVLLAWPVFTVMEQLTDRCRDELVLASEKLRSLRQKLAE